MHIHSLIYLCIYYCAGAYSEGRVDKCGWAYCVRLQNEKVGKSDHNRSSLKNLQCEVEVFEIENELVSVQIFLINPMIFYKYIVSV